MNASSYMDKQITELSSSNPSLLNLDEDDQDHAFNFHPIRPLQSLSKSLDSAPVRGWSSMDQIDAAKVTGNRGGSSVDDELILRIEQKLKEHADALLHSMECLSARVSQIETRTRQVENSFDELKEAFEFNHGKLSGKLLELENVLMEVHTTVKDLRDKQEIADTQQLLAKLQASKTEKQPETQTSTVNQTEPIPPHQSNPPPPIPSMFTQPIPPSPALQNPPPQNYPPAPPASAHQFPQPPAPQPPTVAATAPQISFPQPESFPSVQISAPGVSNQPHMPPNYQSQPPAFPHQSHSPSPLPPPAHQPYQPPPHFPPNSQLPQLPQPYPPANLRAEEPPYLQSHHGVQKPSQPQERPPHQFYNPNSPQRNYNQLSSMRYPEPPPVDHNYNSPTHSGGSAVRPFQSSLPAPYTGSETGYSRLPTARELPRAIPTASSVDSRSNGSESGNRVPIDDVIDKVVAMGFRRDLVRATVNKLTENGQHVDLNVVLDKLMNS